MVGRLVENEHGIIQRGERRGNSVQSQPLINVHCNRVETVCPQPVVPGRAGLRAASVFLPLQNQVMQSPLARTGNQPAGSNPGPSKRLGPPRTLTSVTQKTAKRHRMTSLAANNFCQRVCVVVAAHAPARLPPGAVLALERHGVAKLRVRTAAAATEQGGRSGGAAGAGAGVRARGPRQLGLLSFSAVALRGQGRRRCSSVIACGSVGFGRGASARVALGPPVLPPHSSESAQSLCAGGGRPHLSECCSGASSCVISTAWLYS